MNYIVVIGDPVSGLAFIGPFPTHTAAIEYAEGHLDQWWVAQLIKQDKT